VVSRRRQIENDADDDRTPASLDDDHPISRTRR
jgi:hypothetical protein